MSDLLVTLLRLASFVFLARALMSWFPVGPDSASYPAWRMVHRLTEPVLSKVRSILPSTGALDLSTLAVLLVISFVLVPIARSL